MTAIVVGIDGSDGSRRALAWALEEARLRQASPHARVDSQNTSSGRRSRSSARAEGIPSRVPWRTRNAHRDSPTNSLRLYRTTTTGQAA